MGTSVGPTALLAGNLKRGNFAPMQFNDPYESMAD